MLNSPAKKAVSGADNHRRRGVKDNLKPSILLADEDVAFRTSLEEFLEPHFTIAGSVGDGLAMVEAAQALEPDVVIADIRMPVLNGIRAVRQLISCRPDARVIFLTFYEDPVFVTEARKTGALGYVPKRTAADHLIAAIHEVLEGRVFICPGLLDDSTLAGECAVTEAR